MLWIIASSVFELNWKLVFQTTSHYGCFTIKHTAQTDDRILIVSFMICFSKSSGRINAICSIARVLTYHGKLQILINTQTIIYQYPNTQPHTHTHPSATHTKYGRQPTTPNTPIKLCTLCVGVSIGEVFHSLRYRSFVGRTAYCFECIGIYVFVDAKTR